MAADQIDRKARIVLAGILIKAAKQTDVTPSTAMAAYFAEYLREEALYEADVQRRIDSLIPPDPGYLPAPTVRRVPCAGGRALALVLRGPPL